MKSGSLFVTRQLKRVWLVVMVLVLGLVAGSGLETAVPAAAHHVPTSNYWNFPGPLPAGVQHYTFQSNYLLPGSNTVGLNVYLPPGYESPGNTQRYPVIYYLHGINGNERNYFTWFDDIYNQPSILGYVEGTVQPPPGFTIPQVIAVFVNGGKQSYYNNYFDEFHGPTSPFPIPSETLLLNEVIPFVDNNFRTIASRAGRGLEGLSMGARGSMKLLFKYPDQFCSAIAYGGATYEEGQNGTFYEGPFPLEERLSYIIETNAAQAVQHNIWLRVAVGEMDYGQQNGNAQLHDWLVAANVPHEYDPAIPNTVHNLTQYYANTGAYGLDFHGRCFEAAASGPTPTPSGDTPTPTIAPSPTQTATPTATPSPTADVTATSTTTETPSPTPTATQPAPTATQTPSPTTTQPVPTATQTPSPTVTQPVPPTNTPTPTATSTGTQTTGWQLPTAQNAGPGGDGNGFEIDPTAVFADDGVFAQDINSGSGSSTSCTSPQRDTHNFQDFGFSIPAGATINGIQVRLNGLVDATIGAPKACVQLSWDGGLSWSAARSVQFRNTNENTFTLGNATFLWGRSWNANDFSNGNFRVRVINVSSDTLRDFYLDWVGVQVYYQP